MNKIEIKVYDPKWEKTFLKLKRVFAKELSDLIIAIEHVGSTSVKGLGAKPIVDMDVVIKDYSILPRVIQRLEKLGYYHRGNLGIEEREAFGRKNEFVPWCEERINWPEHHLYVCPQESKELHRHLAFRDYLRTHPKTAEEYEQLKRELAKSAQDRECYTLGKSEFVEDVLKKVIRS